MGFTISWRLKDSARLYFNDVGSRLREHQHLQKHFLLTSPSLKTGVTFIEALSVLSPTAKHNLICFCFSPCGRELRESGELRAIYTGHSPMYRCVSEVRDCVYQIRSLQGAERAEQCKPARIVAIRRCVDDRRSFYVAVVVNGCCWRIICRLATRWRVALLIRPVTSNHRKRSLSLGP